MNNHLKLNQFFKTFFQHKCQLKEGIDNLWNNYVKICLNKNKLIKVIVFILVPFKIFVFFHLKFCFKILVLFIIIINKIKLQYDFTWNTLEFYTWHDNVLYIYV